MNKLKLSKRVPARTVAERAEWCRKDFCEMTQGFRNIRSRMKNKMDKCFWCGYAFVDGDMMALAAFKRGNRTLCSQCADKLLDSSE